MKKALITGIRSQDGAYLSRLLLEKGLDKKSGRILVEISPESFRPAEVDILIGDCSKAGEKLGWQPKVAFEGLTRIMVEADLKRVKKTI